LKINKDFMDVMRRGKWLDAQTYRKQHESAWVVFYCVLGCVIIILIALLTNHPS
jgi:hypothetical protein